MSEIDEYNKKLAEEQGVTVEELTKQEERKPLSAFIPDNYLLQVKKVEFDPTRQEVTYQGKKFMSNPKYNITADVVGTENPDNDNQPYEVNFITINLPTNKKTGAIIPFSNLVYEKDGARQKTPLFVLLENMALDPTSNLKQSDVQIPELQGMYFYSPVKFKDSDTKLFLVVKPQDTLPLKPGTHDEQIRMNKDRRSDVIKVGVTA